MFSESAHLAARLQKDLLTRSSTGGETLNSGASSGTPSTVNMDRSVSSSLLHLSKHELSLDALGLLSSHHQDNVEGHSRPGFFDRQEDFDANARNSLSFALTEMTKVLERAAPEVKKVRSASSVRHGVRLVRFGTRTYGTRTLFSLIRNGVPYRTFLGVPSSVPFHVASAKGKF